MLCENLINKPIKLIKCNSNYLLGTRRFNKFQIIADLIIPRPVAVVASKCSQSFVIDLEGSSEKKGGINKNRNKGYCLGSQENKNVITNGNLFHHQIQFRHVGKIFYLRSIKSFTTG